ncbi:hypothetical protein, partial [Arthrobacter sp. N199823]|uniref:hypothetical protein n=1 Tax=Arthrobacter sp. N199823 TaxID=2058895 RepID=UPI0035BE5F59
MPGGSFDGGATGGVAPSGVGGEGTLLPTTSPAADLSTSPAAAAAGIVSADSATDPAAGTKSSDVAAALYFADPAALADSEGRNPANLLDLLDVVGDGSGLVGDVVDGVVEDPQADYERQLVELAAHGVLVDPPLPEALVLVKVPFLGLLGITDEPAELVGPQGGP